MSYIVVGCLLFFSIAVLYSSIGHAGASGYLAVMALLSFAPESIKPTSLILNILVAAIASYRFISQGYFDKRIFLSFIVFSLPTAFLGGYLKLSPFYFKLIAGTFLIISAVLLLLKRQSSDYQLKEIKQQWLYSAVFGSLIGFVSGIIGVGGGIFLTPVILLLGWTTVKNASGISALFILLNSVSGLLGHLSSLNKLDANSPYWIFAVITGGILGSYLGTKKFNNRVIIYCLFVVLLTAGLKFIFVDAMR